MSEGSRVRVGLIGYGFAGRIFHVPFIQATPTLHLRAIVTSKREEIHAIDPTIRIYSKPEELFQDTTIDLVVIATPSGIHHSLALQALQAKKHLVVDKPFTLTYQETKEVLSLAEEVHCQIFAFHNRRWDTDFLSIRQAIDEGIIGKIVHFESHIDRFRPIVRDRWREDGSLGSGVWYDLGPHLIDQALLLFGRPQSILAEITSLREGSASDDFAHVILRYDHLRVILQASLSSPNGKEGGSPRFAVYGKSGMIRKDGADPQEPQLLAGMTPRDAQWGVDTDPLHILDGNGQETLRPAVVGSQEKFYELVAEVIRGNPLATIPIHREEILNVQEVLEAARISAVEGRVVTLPL